MVVSRPERRPSASARANLPWRRLPGPGGGIGIRSGLKIRGSQRACGFESHPGHRVESERIESRTMATESAQEAQTFHGGRLIARRLKAHGVSRLFTLSGGHLFSIYDGCREEGIEIVDVRHESTAAFAAEGWAKVTREPGVCALTAGPGVTNGMSAIASAQQNHSPMVVLGGRAPAGRWGMGSLQEIDHVPFVRPLSEAGGDARQHRGDPGPGRRGVHGRDDAARRADVPGLPDGLRVHGGGRSRRRRSEGLPAPREQGRGRRGDRTRGRAAEGRRAAGDHGGDGPVLGTRRAGAAGAGARRCGSPYS